MGFASEDLIVALHVRIPFYGTVAWSHALSFLVLFPSLPVPPTPSGRALHVIFARFVSGALSSRGRASEVASKYLREQKTLNEALRSKYAADLDTLGDI